MNSLTGPQFGNVKRYQNKNRPMLLAGIFGAIVKTSVVFAWLKHGHISSYGPPLLYNSTIDDALRYKIWRWIKFNISYIRYRNASLCDVRQNGLVCGGGGVV